MFEGRIDALTPKGTGLLFDKERPVYISDGLPNEHVNYDITHHAKTYSRARVTKIITPNPDRVLPICPLSGRCGGCQLQHYHYPAQLAWKQALLAKALSGFNIPLLPPISGPPFHWRNKLQLDVTGAIIGLSERDSAAYVDIPHCFLVSETTNSVLTHLRAMLKKDPLQGLSRIVIREHGGQHLLVFYAPTIVKKTLLEMQAIPQVASIYVMPPGSPPTAHCLYGQTYLWQSIGDLAFPIGPDGFFQGNAACLNTFVSAVADACHLSPKETLWDLHAGSGLLGLSLAKKAKNVVLSETYPNSRAMGEMVISKFMISNAYYRAISAEESILQLPDTGHHTVLLDPPRKGCTPELMAQICAKKQNRVVYVSCNLPPFVAAAKQLCAAGYLLSHVQLVDMFPHTIHAETIAVFVKERPDLLCSGNVSFYP